MEPSKSPSPGAPSSSSSSSAHLSKCYLSLGGMTCSACSGTIERALRSMSGVISARVSLLTERAEILYDTRLIHQQSDFVEQVENVGFEASIINTGKSGLWKLKTQSLNSADIETLKAQILDEEGVTGVEIISAAAAGEYEIHISASTVPPLPSLRTILSRLRSNASSPSSSSSSTSSPRIHLSDISLIKDDLISSRSSALSERRTAELTKWRRAFWTSMLFTLPTMFVAMICPQLPYLHDVMNIPIYHNITLKALLLWILVTPVQFGSECGMRFYIAAYKSLRHGNATMDVLITLGSSAAYLYSVLIVILCIIDHRFMGMVFFETSAMLISIVLLGRYAENLAKGRTSDALARLITLAPNTATIVTLDEHGCETGEAEEVDVSLVSVGDIVRVTRGSKVPVDGVIVKGHTSIDESLVTGESMPVVKQEKSTLIGGTLNIDTTIYMRVTGVGADTVLNKIVSLVNDAQTSKAPIQAFADRVARIFVPIVCLLSFLTWLVWYILLSTGIAPHEWVTIGASNFLFAFLFAVAVLVISCPCSLGLATPTAVMVGTGVGARLGVLFKGGEPLEITGKCNVVMFDKTGTLTQGKPSLQPSQSLFLPLPVGLSQDEFWALVASAESQSEHLLGKAIAAYAKQAIASGSPFKHEVPACTQFNAVSGAGIEASVNGYRILIGNERWLQTHDVSLPAECDKFLISIQERGDIAICVAINNTLTAILCVSDALKPESPRVVKILQKQGIEVYMITGDSRITANYIGKKLGIPQSNIMAQLSPSEKAAAVRALQGDRISSISEYGYNPSRIVMFVGDGINDSPALAASDVGVAIGSGTDIAVDTAGVVLMRHDLYDVCTCMHLSRATLRRIRWNFRWATIYNILAIPLAAGILYPMFRLVLPPVVAAAAMGCSSVSVILSSLWLKRYEKPNWAEYDVDEEAEDDDVDEHPHQVVYQKGPRKDGYSRVDHGRSMSEEEEVELGSFSPIKTTVIDIHPMNVVLQEDSSAPVEVEVALTEQEEATLAILLNADSSPVAV